MEISKESKPDVFHIHSCSTWVFGALETAARTRIPAVYEARGFWEDSAVAEGLVAPESHSYRSRKEMETRAMRGADAVVTISENMKRDVVSRGIDPHDVFVVPNGVDTNLFQPIPRNRELEGQLSLRGRFVLGYVSSLRKMEGVDTLIRATKRLAGGFPDVRLLIVGGGTELNRLKGIVRNIDLEDSVVFTGNVPFEYIRKYYSLIDIFIIPREKSRVTDMVSPLKPLEAMSMAKPCIASRVGGLEELFAEGETGFFFSPGDEEGLATICARLMKDGDLRSRLGQRARKWVTENRDWNRLVDEYVRVYEKASGKVARDKGVQEK